MGTLEQRCDRPLPRPALASVGGMAYPKDMLNDGETVAVDLHPHWWFFAESVSALVFGFFVAVAVGAANLENALGDLLSLLSIAILIVTGAWVAIRFLKWSNTHFVITSQRLIFRQGVIGRSGIEIPLERVNNVNFSQSVFERIIGAGDLLIESGGESGQERFTDIRHPDAVQKMIHAQIETAQQRRSNTQFSASGPDVAEQLERLEALMHRGAITFDEFERQKRRLLS